jgi:hypothetical protein
MDLNKKIARKNGRIRLGLSCADFYSLNKQNRKRIRVNESGARNILIKEGHKPGKVCEKQTLDNKAGVTEASFVFEDLDQKKPAPQTKVEETPPPPAVKVEETPKETKSSTTSRSRRKSRKTQQNSEKTQKNLDNSQKDVIIEEETNTEE